MICRECNNDTSELETNCVVCGSFMGFPNVNAAKKNEEIQALRERYEKAIEVSKGVKNSYSVLKDFETRMKQTCAVINVSLDQLHTLLKNDKKLYSTYCLQTEGEIRMPASEKDDSERRAVESKLFGQYGKHIRYAALSLDGSGLKSYNPFSLKLFEWAIVNRASLLEDNSYHFVSKHGIKIQDEIPCGHRATWDSRHMIAVAKLEHKIDGATKNNEYAKILLRDSGRRNNDEFIEVYIYGPFNNKAIESVKGKSGTISINCEKAILENIKELLMKSGKNWIEE